MDIYKNVLIAMKLILFVLKKLKQIFNCYRQLKIYNIKINSIVKNIIKKLNSMVYKIKYFIVKFVNNKIYRSSNN